MDREGHKQNQKQNGVKKEMKNQKKETAAELLKRTDCAIWEIDGEFYPVHNFGPGQVVDIGGRDAPAQPGTRWFANATKSGVKYVASGSPTRAAALARIRRAFPNEGE